MISGLSFQHKIATPTHIEMQPRGNLVRGPSNLPDRDAVWENSRIAEAMTAGTPLRRLGEPDDVAETVACLSEGRVS
jgi:NAD(P)-dependent dehydrogenase (short-subunit alcohol dehydrogenase family)